jgi:hypothetical protein
MTLEEEEEEEKKKKKKQRTLEVAAGMCEVMDGQAGARPSSSNRLQWHAKP